ncbi:hypothetical protein GCM10009681_31730 [Luedemannella helvata]|uniref:Uncharacterized protein n=2 Tax=Luedemannella helvata TaxID=349315 RepID=A0ABN2KK70_9ACTN
MAALRGRVARFVLLCCTALGVSAMHTMGHHGPDHLAAGHLGAPHSAPHAGAVPDGAVVPPAGEGTLARDAPGPRDGLPAWSVCLAVLAAVGLAVLAALVVRGARQVAPEAPSPAAGRARPARGPPGRGCGLRLATVAVMRT